VRRSIAIGARRRPPTGSSLVSCFSRHHYLVLYAGSLRRLAPGIRVTEETLSELLRLEVLKRDVLEGEKAETAAKLVRRATRKRERERAAETEHEQVTPVAVTPLSSASLSARPVGPANRQGKLRGGLFECLTVNLYDERSTIS
jgi:hypothetical protein